MTIVLIRIIGRPLLLNFFREGLPIRRVYSLIWRNRASKHRLSRLIEVRALYTHFSCRLHIMIPIM